MSLTAVSTRRTARRRARSKRRGNRDGSSFWHFPTAKLFVPDKLPMDTNREAYLGLNRVGGILSEAARSKPQQGEPRYTDMWDCAEPLQEAGAVPPQPPLPPTCVLIVFTKVVGFTSDLGWLPVW